MLHIDTYQQIISEKHANAQTLRMKYLFTNLYIYIYIYLYTHNFWGTYVLSEALSSSDKPPGGKGVGLTIGEPSALRPISLPLSDQSENGRFRSRCFKHFETTIDKFGGLLISQISSSSGHSCDTSDEQYSKLLHMFK